MFPHTSPSSSPSYSVSLIIDVCLSASWTPIHKSFSLFIKTLSLKNRTLLLGILSIYLSVYLFVLFICLIYRILLSFLPLCSCAQLQAPSVKGFDFAKLHLGQQSKDDVMVIQEPVPLGPGPGPLAMPTKDGFSPSKNGDIPTPLSKNSASSTKASRSSRRRERFAAERSLNKLFFYEVK